jgi:hypothetical protein
MCFQHMDKPVVTLAERKCVPASSRVSRGAVPRYIQCTYSPMHTHTPRPSPPSCRVLMPARPYDALRRQQLQQARQRHGQAASPARGPARAEGPRPRPSAEEWLGLGCGSTTAAVTAGSEGRGQSASQWCADAASAAAPARNQDPAAHSEEDVEEIEEEKDTGTSARGNGRAAPRPRRNRDICAERGQEDAALEERWQDDGEERWPKLDINSQHFSSKPEPIILCEHPPLL